MPADPEDLLHELAATEPDREAADRALERSKAAAVRGSAAAPPPPRPFPLWRILVPTSLAAALAAAFFVVSLTSVAPTPATAAEVLERAAAAEAAYDGWYRIERFDRTRQEWLLFEVAQPVDGIRWQLGFLDGVPPQTPTEDFSWNWNDARKHLNVSYDAQAQSATLSIRAPYGDRGPFPLSADRLMQTVEEEFASPFRVKTSPDQTRVEIMSNAEQPQPPHRLVADFQARSGLLQKLSLQLSRGSELEPAFRLTYGIDPPAGWRAMLPDDIEVEDQRPDAETAAVLETLDDIEAHGLGIATAVVVRRGGNFYEGTLRDDGQVELYAERGAARLKLVWERGTDVAGWPQPNLPQVLTHARSVTPDLVDVCDGTTRWHRWYADDWKVTGRSSRDAGGPRLAAEFWPTREDLLGGSLPDVRLEGSTAASTFDSKSSTSMDGFRLVATTTWRPGGVETATESARFTLRRDLAMPREWITHTPGLASKTTRSYSDDHLVMFREPYRVPTRWRTDHAYPDTGERAIPQFHRLLPFHDVTLDASWFTDPRDRWPDAD